jgi:hypothetical protein
LLDLTSPALCKATSARHDQDLPQRMGVPCGSSGMHLLARKNRGEATTAPAVFRKARRDRTWRTADFRL